MNLRQLLVIERSQHKKINREIYTCVSILLFAGSPVQAGQACYGIQLYDLYVHKYVYLPSKNLIVLHEMQYTCTRVLQYSCFRLHPGPEQTSNAPRKINSQSLHSFTVDLRISQRIQNRVDQGFCKKQQKLKKFIFWQSMLYQVLFLF